MRLFKNVFDWWYFYYARKIFSFSIFCFWNLPVIAIFIAGNISHIENRNKISYASLVNNNDNIHTWMSEFQLLTFLLKRDGKRQNFQINGSNCLVSDNLERYSCIMLVLKLCLFTVFDLQRRFTIGFYRDLII